MIAGPLKFSWASYCGILTYQIDAEDSVREAEAELMSTANPAPSAIQKP